MKKGTKVRKKPFLDRCLVNEKEVNPEKEAYVTNRMKEVDFDNLFVTK